MIGLVKDVFPFEDTLNVHHRYYIPDRDPWDYPDEMLLTLCEECHETEQGLLKDILSSFPRIFLDKFLPTDLIDIMSAIHSLDIPCSSDVFSSALSWYIQNHSNKMMDDYFYFCKEMSEKRKKNGRKTKH